MELVSTWHYLTITTNLRHASGKQILIPELLNVGNYREPKAGGERKLNRLYFTEKWLRLKIIVQECEFP